MRNEPGIVNSNYIMDSLECNAKKFGLRRSEEALEGF